MSGHRPGNSQYASEYSGRPLVNVCIAFAVLETSFIIAFVFSWHLNRDSSSHNTKGVYALILLTYLFTFAGVVICLLKITNGGVGYHASTLQPETVRTALQLMTAHEATYTVAIAFPKLAILSLYLRLFTAKVARYLLYLTGVVIIGACLFGILAVFTNCRPLTSFWDLRFEDCTVDPMMAFRLYGIPIIATDVVILVVPIIALWRLKVSVWEKLAVALTFLVIACGIVASVLRLVAFVKTDIFEDTTYLCISTSITTIIEPGIYLVAATVPTLKPAVRQMCQRIFFMRPAIASGFRSSRRSNMPPVPAVEQPRLIRHIPTKKSYETLGQRPKKTLQLDDYHRVRYGPGLVSLSTADEESMVCADAIVHETMGRQGRNPDGTLRAYSLQPMQFSPLRTSFFLDKSDSDTSRSAK